MYELPPNLPEPIDDGATRHLLGHPLPNLSLPTSTGGQVNLSTLSGRLVVYIYPMSGDDDSLLPPNWNDIPGARGCTPEHCNIRDHHDELNELGVRVFGLATQTPSYLSREVERLNLPYPLISDQNLELTHKLALPVLPVKVGDQTVLKRATLIVEDGLIVKVFYPVFPPDKAAEQVIGWLHSAGKAQATES